MGTWNNHSFVSLLRYNKKNISGISIIYMPDISFCASNMNEIKEYPRSPDIKGMKKK